MSAEAVPLPQKCPQWCEGEHAVWRHEGAGDSHWCSVAEPSSDGAGWTAVSITREANGWARVEIDGQPGHSLKLPASEARGLAAALIRAADMVQLG